MFVRLRILHPIVAGALGVCLLVLAFRVNASRRTNAFAKCLGGTVAALVLFQFSLGCADVLLKTPAWLQLLHLLAADLLWIAFVLLAAELLRTPKAAPTASLFECRAARSFAVLRKSSLNIST